MKVLPFIILLSALSQSFQNELRSQWNDFKELHHKGYTKSEDLHRFEIFKSNLNKINTHNELYKKHHVTYEMALNQFADLTHEEFVQHLKISENQLKYNNFVQTLNVSVPDEIDWRQNGAVTPVKNQGTCGSSWSYSLTGVLEGQNFLKISELIPLSVQELSDCVNPALGCTGGSISDGYQYVAEHGLSAESAYPTINDGTCQRESIPSAVTIQGYATLNPDEETLKEVVGTTGPVAVNVDASNWQFYSRGVFLDANCNQQFVNHAVLVVGYGTGVDYWLVKNSWGTAWGEDGYIELARNADNNCGVASYATIPIL